MLSRKTPLKRVPFKSKPPAWLPREERTRAPLQPIRVPAPCEPRQFAPIAKMDPLRSEQYRRFVASHPCFWCGLAGSSQCAHANEGKGMAMKVCDRRTFPLCFRCHSDFDQSRGLTRDERRAKEAEYVDRMQALARAAGRPEFREEIEA